jgi:uncharacterized surface protein with fasciclin (FAS1) repeats
MKRFLLFIGMFLIVSATPTLAQVPEARLRIAHYISDMGELDIYIDDVRVTPDPLMFRRATAHLVVPTTSREVAIVASNTPLADALLTVPLELTGGHDHTLALIGLAADETVTTVMLNESELVGAVRDPARPASYAVLLHGIANGPAIDFFFDGEQQVAGLAYGQYAVIIVEAGAHDVLVTFSGRPDEVLFANSGETAPSNNLLLLTVMTGSYPDNLTVSGAVSRLEGYSALDYLRDYQGEESFSVLLELLDAAELDALFTQEGLFTLFAPTDAAFAALPDDTLNLLRADRDALRTLLENHIVEQNFNTRYMETPLELITMNGSRLRITGDEESALINERVRILFGGFPAVVNGNVIGIDRVLMPKP